MTHRIDYIWLDSDGNIRQKTMFNNSEASEEPSDFPIWTFDGSSCGLATTEKSDLILKPVRIFRLSHVFPFQLHTLVLCEVYNGDMTPHSQNTRHNYSKVMELAKSDEPLFGIEQEYVIVQRDEIGNMKPYMWFSSDSPFRNPELNKQGQFYCGVGGNHMFGRQIVDEHVELCLDAGIQICGINAEVMASQWEYQIGPLPGDIVADQLIVSRYLLQLAAEKFGADISFSPKPVRGWNGSGGHTNFSTNKMRTSYDAIIEACEKLALKHEEHMTVYGKNNNERLCGSYETSDPKTFTYGVGNRSCSVRIPQHCFINKCGYLEDRRPAANLDPYLVCAKIVETVCL